MHPILAAVMVLLQAQAQQSTGESFGVRLREWATGIDGSLRGDGNASQGTGLDLGGDLGVDGRALTHAVEFFADIPSLGRYSLSYWRGVFEGQETPGSPFVFDDRLFAAAEEVDTRLRFDLYSLDYAYPVLQTSFDLGLIAGARLFTGEAVLESTTVQASSVIHRPLLLLGVILGAELAPWLRVEGGVEGMAFTVPKLKARYLEASVEAVANPWEGLLLGVGYRFMKVDLESLGTSTNFDLDATFDGLSFSVGYRF